MRIDQAQTGSALYHALTAIRAVGDGQVHYVSERRGEPGAGRPPDPGRSRRDRCRPGDPDPGQPREPKTPTPCSTTSWAASIVPARSARRARPPAHHRGRLPAGDSVLIAGKGRNAFQIFADRVIPVRRLRHRPQLPPPPPTSPLPRRPALGVRGDHANRIGYSLSCDIFPAQALCLRQESRCLPRNQTRPVDLAGHRIQPSLPIRSRCPPAAEAMPNLQDGLAGVSDFSRRDGVLFPGQPRHGAGPDVRRPEQGHRRDPGPFAIVAGPTVNLLHDPEIDGLSYVVVEITIQAKPQEALAAHRASPARWSSSSARAEFLKLHYQIA